MKKVFTIIVLFFLASSFIAKKESKAEIKWLSWEEAIQLNKKNPRKIFVDIYTDWCGWCKKMDATTFSDKKVAAFMNENFYCVKFDAEQKEDVILQGDTLRFNPNNGRRGSHDLAVALLNGQMSYPSYVYLDKDLKRISISPGYKTVEPFLTEIGFIAGDFYLKMSYQEYTNSIKK